MYIFRTASRRHLLCCILFAILFTLMAYPQSVGATPQRHSLSSSSTPNWAGYTATSAQATFTEISMIFTVPTLEVSSPNDGISMWAGVGGGTKSGGVAAPNQELVQAGVFSGSRPYAFWEIVSNGKNGKNVGTVPMKLDNGNVMYVKPGDLIWVYVGSENSSHHKGYDGFLVKDLTQGTYAVHYVYVQSQNINSDSRSAECIVERSATNSGFTLLTRFPNPIPITGCGVYTNGQAMVPIGNFSPIQMNMVDKNNTQLATTSDLRNGTDFDVTWHNTGTGT